MSGPTARGDRDGRRRDVLTAAAEILDESGWDGLSIRATAARAGVSAGAVYQWFSGKDEILGELYDREVRAGLEFIETVADPPLDEIMRLMLDLAVNLHDKLGRPEVQFTAASDGQSGREIGPSMRSTYERLGERVDEMLDRAAATENLSLVEDDHRLTWIWAGCVGTADRLAALPRYSSDEKREELLQFAAEALTRSLIA